MLNGLTLPAGWMSAVRQTLSTEATAQAQCTTPTDLKVGRLEPLRSFGKLTIILWLKKYFLISSFDWIDAAISDIRVKAGTEFGIADGESIVLASDPWIFLSCC